METTEVMNRYETITTILSIIAIFLSIIIPLVQWGWKKWIVTAKVKFYSTGQAMLFLIRVVPIFVSTVYLNLKTEQLQSKN